MFKPNRFPFHVSRRGFLAAGTAGAALLTPAMLRAEEPETQESEIEKKNEEVVLKMCEEISHVDPAKLEPFFVYDFVFQLVDNQPLIEGNEACMAMGQHFFQAFERAEVVIHLSYVIGNLVINERDDHFYPKTGGDRTTFQVSGFFLVKDGKIVVWKDYALPS